MSTNSTIAMLLPDGRVRGIYCHWDGSLGWNGEILNESYASTEKVTALLELGFLSGLGESLVPDPTKPHTWKDAQPGVCVAYHRDRGDAWEDVKPIEDDMDAYYEVQAQHFNYLWKDGTWWVGRLDSIHSPVITEWISLEKELKNKME